MKQKKFKFSGDLLTFILVAAVYAVVAYLLYGGSLTRQFSNMIIPISVYIVLAVSLNLVVGLLGELSLGHAGFMSVGLFSGCLLSIALVDVLPMAVRLPLSMVIGGLVAALFGLAVGLPALRLKGDYLAIVTCKKTPALRCHIGAAHRSCHDEPQALQAGPRHHGHPG